MFAYLPEATQHLARFTQEILRGPAPFSPGHARVDRGVHFVPQRLPVLTEVARRSCGGTVGQRGAGLGRASKDLETSALDEKHKALFRFVDKVNHDSPRITPEDMKPLTRRAGTTRRSISPSRFARCSISTIAGSTRAVCTRSLTRRTGREESAPPRTAMSESSD